jgi:cytochrome c-type biogenesis protein
MGRHGLSALLLAVLVLALTVTGALVAGPTGGSLAMWLERTSGGLSAAIGRAGSALPFGYAFAAGMLAAVNPCGFVLVPAYLGTYLWSDGQTVRRRELGRALAFSVAVSAGFVVLFAAAGLLLGGIGTVIVLSLPWLGLLVGVLLVAYGALALTGGPTPSLAASERLAGPFTAAAARPGLPGYAAYGVAYGLASLGCALPVFLTVVGGALSQGLFRAVALFVLYGLGLSAVLSATALLAAVLGTGVVARLRWARRLMPPLGAALLLLAGAYITYYWLTAGDLLGRLLA